MLENLFVKLKSSLVLPPSSRIAEDISSFPFVIIAWSWSLEINCLFAVFIPLYL